MNKIAGDFVTFMDDVRVVGFSLENCWQCGRRLSSQIQRWGIQEAARKHKPPSLNTNSWVETIIKTEGVVDKTIS